MAEPKFCGWPEAGRPQIERFVNDVLANVIWSERRLVIRGILDCMTMLSFRVDERDAAEVQRWARALGVDRSELLREAVRRHLDRLASEEDADRWAAAPMEDGERSLGLIADWGPAEDWTDWADEEG